MTTKKIIYWDGSGNIIALNPTPAFCGLTVEQIAKKDVPPGAPYLILDESELPTSVVFSDAWSIDPNTTPHGFGENYGVGSTNAVIGWEENGNPILRDES